MYFPTRENNLLKETPKSKKKSKIILFVLGGLMVSYVLYKKVKTK